MFRRRFSTATLAVPLGDALMSRLEAACRVSTNASILDRHGDDESHHPAQPPAAVAYARSTEEVQAVVRLCAEHRVPLIPFGAGTSLEGHIVATRSGSVSLDLSEMNALLDVSVEDMDCAVQAGLTRLSLNSELRHTGLRFPVDPGADASLGGMAACGASGTSAVRCGTMRENTLGLTAVLANGEVISTGGRARKSSAGYDLTRLLIGSYALWEHEPSTDARKNAHAPSRLTSCPPPPLPPPVHRRREGTLGVITELKLRLHAVPPAAAAAVCTFPSLAAAASAVALVLQCAVPVSRCEILDATSITAFNAYAREVPDLAVAPTLMFEFEGASEAAVAEQAETTKECCAELGGGSFEWATKEEERRRLWQARLTPTLTLTLTLTRRR